MSEAEAAREAARVRQLLARALAEDPRFAPRAELCYAVESAHGAGEEAVVADRVLGRTATLRLLRGADPERARRFWREAVLLAHLDHPGVPPVLAAGTTAAGRPFFVVRHLRGASLAEALARPPRAAGPRRELLEVLASVAATLAAAHARGIAHRALDPGRVALGAFGEVLLLEWGLARDAREGAAEDAPLRAELAARTRTSPFAAPEVRAGEDAGPAADVYSLGALLAAALTPGPLTTGASPSIPRAPRELASVVRRALAIEPRARYRDALAFSRDLRAWLDGERVEAHRYGPLARLGLGARRHPARAAALTLTLLVLAGTLPLLRDAGARGASAERAAARDRARAGAEAAGREAAARPASLGPALRALSAATGWHGLAPADPAARAARARAALALAALATTTRQWGLAEAALQAAHGLDHEADLARAGAALAEARSAEARSARAAVDQVLAEAESGALEPQGGLGHAVYPLARHPPHLVVEQLALRLDAVSATLAAVQSEVWAEAARPTPKEQALGEQPLEGIPEALQRLAGLLPGEGVQPEEELLLGATRRLLRRAGRRPDALPTDARAEALALIAPRQAQAAGEGALRVAAVCCEALGRLEPGAAGQAALLRYLAAEADQARAIPAGRALARTGNLAALQAVRAAVRRFGINRSFDASLSRELARRPDAVPQLEGQVRVAALFDRAMQRMDQGDLPGAIADFTLVIIAEPGNAGAWGNRGLARNLARDPGGLADLERACQLEPGEPAMYVNRAVVRHERGDPEGAIADYRQALALDPDLVPAHNGLGSVLSALGRQAEALLALDRALELDPDFCEGRANRARVLRDLGRLDEARADLDRALELRPDMAQLHSDQAALLLAAGEVGEATLAARRALELDPDDIQGLSVSAYILAGQRRQEEAYALYTRALQRVAGRERAPLLTNRALTAQQLQRREEALADLSEACSLAPDLAQACWLRGMLLAELGRLEEAREAGDQALRIAPAGHHGWLVRGEARLALGDLEGGRDDLARAASLSGPDLGPRLGLGFAWLLLGDEGAARRELERCQAQQPYATLWLAALGGAPSRLEALAGQADVLGHLARHYLGRCPAEELLRQVELVPAAGRPWARCEVHVHLGLAAQRGGRTQAAREHFQTALATGQRASRAFLVARRRLADLEAR